MKSSRKVLTRRHALTGALLLASPLLATCPAMAADWPERPIRMIIPFAAGAGADTVGRTFGEELAKALKDGFTPEEIAAARHGWMQNREVGRSREGELANRLVGLMLTDRTMAFEADLEKKVAALNNEEILAALRKHFNPAQLSIVKAGDFKNTSQAKK